MSTRLCALRATAVAAFAALGAGVALAAPLYHVINTGIDAAGSAINLAGAISGQDLVFGSDSRVFTWQDGIMTALQTDGNGGEAIALNASKAAAGVLYTADDVAVAAAWNPDGTVVHLGTLPGGFGSGAQGINDAGTIVGWSMLAGFQYGHSVIVRDGTMKDIDRHSVRSSAQAINNHEQVTGGRIPAGAGETHAYLWHAGTYQDLGTLGGNYSMGYAINEQGHVVGTSVMPPDRGNGRLYRAFLYKNHKMRSLGSLGGDSVASAVNGSDVVVGYSRITHQPAVPWVWMKGTMYDLRTVLDGASQGWRFYDANGINDAGQIVARGSPDNGTHNYVVILDPVPQ